MKDNRLYLINIAECIQRIESYTRDGRGAFMKSALTQDAVIWNFEVIGEAARRLPREFVHAHPDVPWRRMMGFRDVLVHDYISVDLNEVWSIVESGLSGLKRKIEAILQEQGGSEQRCD